jgi:hypothetical protein
MSAELHAFFDRDVYIKLVCCDLWNEALAALGVTHPYRLASATRKGSKNVFRNKPEVPDALRDETFERLEIMSKATPLLPEDWVSAAVSSDLYNAMKNIDKIDSGEAELAVVALICSVENRLVTGDKRFIKAMAEAFPEELDKLRPRLITFEACLLAICKTIGFAAIRDRLIAARGIDGTLRNALGSQNQNSEEDFYEGLRSGNPI